LTPGAFCQKRIFWTFWRFSAWIWAKLAPIYSKRHLQHDSMPFFSTSIAFYHILAQACAEIKIWAFRVFKLFFVFPFCPFLRQWLTFFWALFQFKNFWESIIETGNLYHGVAKCSRRKFCSKFFTQISEHFRVYLRLNWADHSGIIGKIFSSSRTWI